MKVPSSSECTCAFCIENCKNMKGPSWKWQHSLIIDTSKITGKLTSLEGKNGAYHYTKHYFDVTNSIVLLNTNYEQPM
jgi:hypothetical protein